MKNDLKITNYMLGVKVDRRTGFVKGIFDDKNTIMSALVGYHEEKSCIEKR